MPETANLDHADSSRPQPPAGALVTIFLVIFTDLLGFGLIIPLLPFYALKHQASPLGVTLLFSVYSICQFIASPVLGSLSDRYGRRPVLLLSQMGSVAGYVLLGWATQHEWHDVQLGLAVVYLSRIIDGLSGGNISTAQAYISDVTTNENRAKGMGLVGAAFGIGFAAGPAMGGILADVAGKAWPAYAAAAFSLAAAVLTAVRLPEPKVHRPAMEARSWLRPRQFLPILRRPVLGQLMLIWFACMAAFVMTDSTIALYLHDNPAFHWDEGHVGLYFGFVGIIIAVIQGGLIGRLSEAAGEWRLSILGPALVALGLCCTIATAYVPMVGILLLGGAIHATGRSLQQPTISALVSKYSDPREQGVTFGLFQGLGSLARCLGPIVAGKVYGPMHHIGPFVTAAVILAGMSLWTLQVRRAGSER